MKGKKIYGQSREDNCVFCSQKALGKNKQGLPVCKDHKDKLMEDKRCSCGEFMDIKQSKWGAFFLCSNCGPRSLSKALNMDQSLEKGNGTYKLNKSFREKYQPKKVAKERYDKGRIYTLEELENMWKL